MSGTFPTIIDYSAISMESSQQSIVSHSESGRRQSRKVNGHKWLLSVSFPVMPREVFAVLDAFIMAQDGNYDSFYMPYTLDNSGTWILDVTPVTVGAMTAGDTAMTIDAVTNGRTIVAGDIFTLGHDKVYKVVTGDTVVGGEATIEFRPPLIQDVADNTNVTHTDVSFHVAIRGSHKYEIAPARLFRLELDLEESF